MDLVAATASKTCPGEYGTLINVTDRTMKVSRNVALSGNDYTNNTCAVVAKSTPTSTPQPCRAHIDITTVASMEASPLARLCASVNSPSDCPEKQNSGAQQLQVAAASSNSLLEAFGAFFLAST